MNSVIKSLCLITLLMLSVHLKAQTPSKRIWQRSFYNKVSYTNALLNLNGQTTTIEALQKVPDSLIISVEVLTKASATERFGSEGRKGAIVIKTYTPKPLGYAVDSTGDRTFFIASGDTIYIIATTDATLDNIGGWRKLFEAKLNGDVPVNNGAPSGYYVVPVRFIVNTDGSVSDVDVLGNPGYGTAKEVYRVISSSTGWQPALYKGRAVRSVVYKAVTFVVEND